MGLRLRITVLTFFLAFQISAQEELGLKQERFLGLNGIFINPAACPFSYLNWDVNVASFGIFGNTNYGYITETNALDILRNLDQIEIIFDPTRLQEGVNSRSLVFSEDRSTKYGSFNSSVQGPSFYTKFKERFTIGFFNEVNTVVESQSIPSELDAYKIWANSDNVEYYIDQAQVNALVWAEIGLHLGMRYEPMFDFVDDNSLGINVKYLAGFEGISGQLNEAQGYYSVGDSLLGSTVGQATLNYTNSNTHGGDIEASVNGGGFAFDVGYSAMIGDDMLGISLMDVGYIRFNQNAQSIRYSLNDLSLVDRNFYEPLEVADDVVAQLNNDLENEIEDNFVVYLPLALSLQYDKRLNENLYVNGTLIQQVALTQNTLRRDNLIAVSPRYESKWFSAAMPLSLYNCRKVHVGLSGRIAFLTLGTENLFSFLGKQDFQGSDFYLGVRIFPFFKWNRKEKEGCGFM